MEEGKIFLKLKSIYDVEEEDESPSFNLGDLVIVPYVEWTSGEEDSYTDIVEYVEVLEQDSAFDIGYKNINKCSYVIESMAALGKEMNGVCEEEPEEVSKSQLYLLYSEDYKYSASLILRKDILRAFAEEHDCSDVLIVPISDKKLYLYPNYGDLKEHADSLKEILRNVGLDREHIVSDNIYKYKYYMNETCICK